MKQEQRPFSLINGYSFVFEHQGHSIEAWFSALTGFEKVYVDGALVSSQRSLRTDTKNSFTIDDNNFSTSLTAVSLMKGPFVCTLNKNGVPILRQRLVFPARSKTSPIASLVLFMLLGFFFSLAGGYFGFPTWSIYCFIAAVCAVALVRDRRKIRRPFIEEESCF